MLDEPSLGLAPLVARTVYDALVKISELGTTILLVEQNAKLALKIAHYGYILEAGRIVLKGTAEELKSNEDVQELYLGLGGQTDSSKGWRLAKKGGAGNGRRERQFSGPFFQPGGPIIRTGWPCERKNYGILETDLPGKNTGPWSAPSRRADFPGGAAG